MAKDPKEFERGESFFKKALIGTPMAVGAGIGIRGMVSDLRAAHEAGIDAMSRRPLASVEAVERATGLSQEMIARGRLAREERLEYMARNWDRFKTTTGMEVLKRSWADALRFADPVTRDRLRADAARVRGLSTPTEVFNAIHRQFQTNSSDLMGRVFERLESNVSAFERHVSLGLPLPGTPMSFRAQATRNLDILDIPSHIQGRAARISQALGGNLTATRYVREDIFGRGGPEVWKLTFGMAGGDAINLMVPITKDGSFFEGEALRTRYVSTSVLVPNAIDPKVMSREEYLLRQFERDIVPQIRSGQLRDPFEINAAVKALRSDILHTMEVVKNVPPDLEDEAVKAYRISRGESVDIKYDLPEAELQRRREKMLPGYNPSTRVATPEEVAALGKNPAMARLFGGVSPANVAEGRRSLMDWSKIVSASPRAYDWGRRPEQFSRQFALSEEAIKRVEAEGYKEFDVFATGKMRKMYKKGLPPHLRTLYLRPDVHARLMEELGLGRGEALMREGLRDVLEQRMFEATHVTGMDKATMHAINAGTIKKGQVLGQVADTGLPFVAEDPESLRQAVPFRSEGRGDYATIYQVNRYRLRSHEKWFNDLKVLARFTEENMMAQAASKAGVGHRLAGLGFNLMDQSAFDVIASTEDLTKNPALLAKQIISGTHDVLRNTLEEGIDFARYGVKPSPKMEKFVRNPLAYQRRWTEMAQTAEGAFDQKAFLRRAMKFAVEHGGMNPEEFGAVFGVVPEVEKGWQELTEAALKEVNVGAASRQAYLEAMEQGGFAIGKAQLWWGGPASLRGAGGLGSVEPRLFEMLAGGVYGDTGKALSEEFTERLIATDPQKKALQESLTASMASMSGQLKRKAGEEIFDIASRDIAEVGLGEQFTKFLEEGGGWMRAKKGAKEVFVPGMETLTAMQPFTTAGGQGVRGVVPDIFYNMMYRGAQFAEGSIGEKAYERHMGEALEALWKQAAPAGKGGGAWQRGKVAGSRFLEITSMIDGQKAAQMNEVLISRQRMMEMVEEMRQFVPEQEFMQMQAQAEKGVLEGMVARHPFIGQYSAQPVTIRAVDIAKGTSPNMIAIQERSARVSFGFAGQALQETEMLMTPLVGMAADKDADEAALFLVKPENQKRLAKMMDARADRFTSEYVQHQMRMQLMKAGKAAGGAAGLTQIEKMMADVTKIGVTQSHVPRLSVELSMARQAVGHALSGQAEADARFLLEWLEQNPISAKHMNARQISEGGLAQLDTITNALQKADADTLRREIENIVEGNATARRFLKEDIMIENAVMADDGTKLNVDKRLKAINVEQTVNNLMDARRKFEKSGEARMAQLMHARGPRIRPLQDLPRFLNVLQQTGNKTFSGVSKGMTTAANLLQAVGRTAIRHHKAIGLGFAGSIALAMTLSSPEDTIGPGSDLNPGDINMSQGAAAGRMKAADLVPPSPALGSPSVPAMMHTPRATIAPPTQSDRTRVVARTSNMTNTQNLADRINQMTNNRRSVNLSIRDRRSPTGFGGGNNLY